MNDNDNDNDTNKFSSPRCLHPRQNVIVILEQKYFHCRLLDRKLVMVYIYSL